MAECAIPKELTVDRLQSTFIDENLQEQRDELVALDSIFANTTRLKVLCAASDEDKDALYVLQIEVPVHVKEGELTAESWVPYDYDVHAAQRMAAQVPAASKPTFQRTESGRRWHSSFQVSYLPPLCLHVTLPPDYPSSKSPAFSLSALWLDAGQLSALCRELDVLWSEYSGMPIIYTWVDWLQHNTLSHLHLEKRIILSPYTKEEEAVLGDRDPRALPECTDLQAALLKVLRYDYSEECEAFLRDSHVCGICFEERNGSEFFRLNECGHHFCHECLSAYCEMHVKDGTVEQLSCPDQECKASLPPGLTKAVLGDEAYQRWERLQLQRALDTMGDIEWCPRCNSPVIREEEKHLKLAHCTNCFFSFCTECREAWHQGKRGCTDMLATMDELAQQSKDSSLNSEAQKDKEERARKLKLEYLSKMLIRETTKPCPRCRIPIHKVDGCNKVTCKCGSYMCWLCGKNITGYGHFSDGGCELFYDPDTAAHFFGAHLRNRPIPEGQHRLQAALEIDENARQRIAQCPRCRQRNLKEDRNNHLRCWSCRANFCFLCGAVIQGPIGSHFTGQSPCRQHTD